MKKVIIISNIPNPYRLPLFNELNTQLKNEGWDLLVVFGALGYERRKFELNPDDYKFNYKILDSKTYQAGTDVEKTTFSYSGLGKLIRAEKPDVIVVNGFSPATLKVWMLSFLMKFSYVIWSGAILKSGRFDSFQRRLQRKILAKRATSFVVYGNKAKEYLIGLGVDTGKIHIGINTVDTSYFRDETNRLRNIQTPDLKKHLTFLGYLVPRKNVNRLLECVKELAKNRNDFVLDILGDGSEKENLEKFAFEHGISEFVEFHGFIQKKELPSYFAKSACLLFQTDFDIWGLVLNEAMAAGIPVLSSIHAGATFDLIEDGKNGYRVDFEDIEKTTSIINYLLDNPAFAKEMASKASEFIAQKATINKSAAGFLEAIQSA